MRSVIQSRLIKVLYVISVILVLAAYWHSLPKPLFTDPTSTVLESRNGKLLSAIIADDMQWRFPHQDSVPEKFAICIKEFEDRYFDYHPGVNPASVFRALWQNIKTGERISGASTLSMQVIRLSRKGKARTIWQKFVETGLAIRMEMEYSKDEILALYASNAPFGGNVVGLEAAAWRYYARPASKLSWSETATLAVLPNAPALIYPGRNKVSLRKKRDKLLKRLYEKERIDSLTYHLAVLEPLPAAPHDLPQNAMHLLTQFIKQGQKGKRINTTINAELQISISSIVNFHHHRLNNNGIQNAAVLIIDNTSNQVAAYIGNISEQKRENGSNVDIIMAPRSTGSILKPFLYASMLDAGMLLPEALVSDVPAVYGSYRPENYNHQYTGALPASMALSRSLNVPAVHMLSEFGVARFYKKLKDLGLSNLYFSPEHYGLSLILGGAEASLWDLTNAYAILSKTLLNYNDSSQNQILRQARYVLNTNDQAKVAAYLPIEPSAVWHTLKAIQATNRPENQSGWQNFYSSTLVAWKTGTSHGNRDAWAIGVTPRYTIGVWAGNADGEGRPELTGVKASAPILFHVFDLLKPEGWFPKPMDEMREVKVCKRSGFKASELCPETQFIMAPKNADRTITCPYHKIVHLDKTGKYQVNSSCAEPSEIVTQTWFVLPTLMEKYYKSRDPFYKVLPPFKENCEASEASILDVIYPENNAVIFLPRDISSIQKEVIFKAAHRDEDIALFWFVDNSFIQKTTGFHEISVKCSSGAHKLTVTDENGNSVSRKFTIKSESSD